MTAGIRFKSHRLLAKENLKARAKAVAKVKGARDQAQRARARKVRVFRGVGRSI